MDESESTQTQPSSENMQVKFMGASRDFSTKRLWYAFGFSVVGTASAFIVMMVYSLLFGQVLFWGDDSPNKYQLYAEFDDWQKDTGAKPDPVCDVVCEGITSLKRLGGATTGIIASAVPSEENRDTASESVAGISRLWTLIAVLTVFFSHRKLLVEWYRLHGQKAQEKDFDESKGYQKLLGRLFYFVATPIGTYVVTSVIWFILSLIFKELSLNTFWTILVVLVFAGTITFIANYIALVASPLEILFLGLFTFAAGLAVSFGLAQPQAPTGDQWYEVSVSNAGKDLPSAPIFTLTLFATALALGALGYDIDSIALNFIKNNSQTLIKTSTGFIRRHVVFLMRFFYLITIVGFLFVGVIRVPDPGQNGLEANTFLHVGGAVAGIVGVFALIALIPKEKFPAYYRYVMWTIFSAAASSLVLSIVHPNGFSVDFPGEKGSIINMTALELIVFSLAGVLIYLTVDNLLVQANIDAHENLLPPQKTEDS